MYQFQKSCLVVTASIFFLSKENPIDTKFCSLPNHKAVEDITYLPCCRHSRRSIGSFLAPRKTTNLQQTSVILNKLHVNVEKCEHYEVSTVSSIIKKDPHLHSAFTTTEITYYGCMRVPPVLSWANLVTRTS